MASFLSMYNSSVALSRRCIARYGRPSLPKILHSRRKALSFFKISFVISGDVGLLLLYSWTILSTFFKALLSCTCISIARLLPNRPPCMTSLKQSYAKTAARNLSFSFILRLLIFELLPSIVPYLNSSQWRANSSTSILRSLSFESLSMFLALPYFLKIIRPSDFNFCS
ncbi:hypothetical protein BDC45DRAFT_511798 [Circinella umbellata]|nr:hypothetical protein BDC45DRAFT_523827 [Circinella umbellata]KAI7852914.1 hypothetical protein BDC45DRAFT_511798 [Circinella umbellata]